MAHFWTKRTSLVALVFCLIFSHIGCSQAPPAKRPYDYHKLNEFHEALKECDFGTVKKLVRENFNFDHKHKENKPSVIASLRCDPKVATVLIRAGSDLDLPDSDGKLALHHMLENYYRIQHLLKNFSSRALGDKPVGFLTLEPRESHLGRMLRRVVSRPANDFQAAIAEGKLRLRVMPFKRLLHLALEKTNNFQQRDKGDWDAIAYAVYYTGLEQLKVLEEKGANLRSTYGGGKSLLQIAALARRKETISYLVEKGLDTNHVDANGHSLAFDLALSENPKFAKEIAQQQTVDFTTPSKIDGNTPLSLAYEALDSNMADFLRQQGADPKTLNRKNENLWFSLVRGAANKLPHLHKYYSGRTLDHESLAFSRALRHPKYNSKMTLKQIDKDNDFYNLLGSFNNTSTRKRDADWKEQDLNHLAGKIGKDVNPNQVSSNGVTPLILMAQTVRIPALYDRLIQAGAKIDYRDKNGETALFHAVRHNNLTITERLILSGANTKLKNKAGQRITDLASDRGLNPKKVSDVISYSTIFKLIYLAEREYRKNKRKPPKST